MNLSILPVTDIFVINPTCLSQIQEIHWERLRPLENDHQKFYSATSDVIRGGRISTDLSAISEYTAIALSLASALQGLSEEERFEMWKKRVRRNPFDSFQATRYHLEQVAKEMATLVYTTFMSDNISKRFLARINRAIASKKRDIQGWVRSKECKGLIREFLSGTQNLQNYLIMEAKSLRILVFEVMVAIGQQADLVRDDLETLVRNVREKAMEKFKSPEFQESSSRLGRRDAGYFRRKVLEGQREERREEQRNKMKGKMKGGEYLGS